MKNNYILLTLLLAVIISLLIAILVKLNKKNDQENYRTNRIHFPRAHTSRFWKRPSVESAEPLDDYEMVYNGPPAPVYASYVFLDTTDGVKTKLFLNTPNNPFVYGTTIPSGIKFILTTTPDSTALPLQYDYNGQGMSLVGYDYTGFAQYSPHAKLFDKYIDLSQTKNAVWVKIKLPTKST